MCISTLETNKGTITLNCYMRVEKVQDSLVIQKEKYLSQFLVWERSWDAVLGMTTLKT